MLVATVYEGFPNPNLSFDSLHIFGIYSSSVFLRISAVDGELLIFTAPTLVGKIILLILLGMIRNIQDYHSKDTSL